MLFGSFLILFIATTLPAQTNPYGKRFYKVVSSTSSSLTISITPEYSERTVTDALTGEEYTRINTTGGTTDELTIGMPALEWLRLPILLPSSKSPTVEVVEAESENVRVSLAPLPNIEHSDKQFVEVYKKADKYFDIVSKKPLASVRTSGTFRTAYSGELVIHPMSYDAGSKVLSRVTKLLVRITFDTKQTTISKSSTTEASFFRTGFINGNVREFYRSAIDKVAPRTSNTIAYKGAPQAGETWIAVKTTDEGVYRITSGNLQQYASNIDPSTIALYGFGGMTLPESIDSTTGDLQEVAIDVRTDGSGNFQELRFFAPGTTSWGYRSEFANDKLFKLYHERNPYSAHGMFYLKIGGTEKGKRIIIKTDSISSNPISQSTVFSAYIYENEQRFEVPNISREFLGEVIPLGRDVTVSIPALPGYTNDSVIIRPAVDAKSCEANTISVKVNNTDLGVISPSSLNCGNDDLRYLTREWGTDFALPSSVSVPQSFTFMATSNDKSSKYWLNFIEIFYLRKAELNDGQVPFMLFSDTNSYRFTFTNATTGEVWDVSDVKNAKRIATANGPTITADVRGGGEILRKFIAFSDGNIKYPELSSLSPMTLRTSVCLVGAEVIIITPEAFLAQANELAGIRERGGQATNALTTAVVTVEDITKEFGYGTKDVTAIRDFLAYTFRMTAKNGGTVPLFATLFGNGHADYMNRIVPLEQRVPIYETNNWGSVSLMRKDYPDPVPDDVYFVRLTPTTGYKVDIAIGRVTVQTVEEAENFVSKTLKYETSSDEGPWRAKTVFITDDRYYNDTKRSDPINHLIDSENEVAEVDKRLIIDKLYSHVYQHITISGGQRRKPEFEKAIVNAFNSGAVLISYAGHGNPNVWTNESVLNVPSTINKFSNLNRLAFTTTATCDFSEFDNCNNPTSGGVQTLTKPDGGCIGSLATSRSVYPGEELVYTFYDKLFEVGCDELQGTNHVGFAYSAGRLVSANSYNANKFFILGDPAQRLLVPRQYVVIDSINGKPFRNDSMIVELASLSVVHLSGHISNTCDGADIDMTFNGTSSVTLFDAPTKVEQTSTFTQTSPITDTWWVDGPILYRGSATVNNGRFSTSFIVPKDIKFDSNNAKIHLYASSNDFRSAVGVTTSVRVYGVDPNATNEEDGPDLTVYIGSRRFKSGDVVPIHSKIIVDVKDISGINTSTAGIGHSFIGWANDSTANVIDFAENYVSAQDDYSSGTSEKQTILPQGRGVLNVRAFDALNNPTFASVEFIASDDSPYKLYDVAVQPSPARRTATFSFLQPSAPDSPVDILVDIYTTDGRKVQELSALNLRDMSGSTVPDAGYTYRINVKERLTGRETMMGGVFIVQRQ
jgi:phage FluMu protein gp41